MCSPKNTRRRFPIIVPGRIQRHPGKERAQQLLEIEALISEVFAGLVPAMAIATRVEAIELFLSILVRLMGLVASDRS